MFEEGELVWWNAKKYKILESLGPNILGYDEYYIQIDGPLADEQPGFYCESYEIAKITDPDAIKITDSCTCGALITYGSNCRGYFHSGTCKLYIKKPEDFT